MCMLECRQVMESEPTDRLRIHYHLRLSAINLSRNAIRTTHEKATIESPLAPPGSRLHLHLTKNFPGFSLIEKSHDDSSILTL